MPLFVFLCYLCYLSGMKEQNTKVRSLRFSRKLWQHIERQAVTRGQSVNSMCAKMLKRATKYKEE